MLTDRISYEGLTFTVNTLVQQDTRSVQVVARRSRVVCFTLVWSIRK